MRGIIGLAALTAAVGTAASGPAVAEIALFGDARLGFGHNIANNGTVDLEPGRREDGVVVSYRGAGDTRAVSRVRFGVRMTGESDAGIGFGATIRADNAAGGQGGTTGQRSGNVFVTGDWGTLTFGDTPGADQQHVGTGLGNQSLTGLGDFDQLPFLSNGGGSDNDTLEFLADPEGLPTVRYDYTLAGFGVSVSANRQLDSVAFGLGYAVEPGEGVSLALGAGYYDFSAYEGRIDNWGLVAVPDGSQWSLGAEGRYHGFLASVGYASIDAGDLGRMDVLALGLGYNHEAWRLRAFYSAIANGDRQFGRAFDGRDSYGASVGYDLGGGATLNAGVSRSYGADEVGAPGDANFAPAIDAATVADLGIRLNF